MYPRPYPRPFERATSPVRSRYSAAKTLPARLRVLATAYRRTFGFAALLAVLLHGILFFVIREKEPYRPQSIIGYEGPMRILAIEVTDTDTEQERLAEDRRRSGALVATEIQTETTPESPAPRDVHETEHNELASLQPVEYYVIEAPPAVTHPDPDAPIRVELREDFSIDVSSTPSARSLDIKLLWMVRPQYPTYARRAGIQGLVRLEAEVGITGKVLDVHVLETPDGGLALAASRSLLLWEFQPLEMNGELRKFRVVVPFRFTLLS
ncbi:MAG: energy transducer TonB [Candidatus Eisenbacteria bacterium]